VDLSREEAEELLAAEALDALPDEEGDALAALLDADQILAAEADRLRAVTGLLATTALETAPEGLASRMLGAAFVRRVPVDPGTVPAPVNEAYLAQNDELAGLLDELGSDEWGAETLVHGLTAQQLVAHLTGVAHHLGSLLGLEPFEVGGLGHHEMTQPLVDAQHSLTPSQTRAAWRRQLDRLRAPVAALDDDALEQRVDFHGIDLSLRSVVGAYVFEAWSHGDDIRRATGRALVSPGAARLRGMCEQAVAALPLGLLIAGIDREGEAITVVLTGPGGGTFHQSLRRGDPDPAEPAHTVLVADAVDFCRLAAMRIAPGELEHHVRGDGGLVADVLVGVQVFAG